MKVEENIRKAGFSAVEMKTRVKSRAPAFIQRHALEVYRGGWRVLLRKTWNLILKVLTPAGAAPAVLVARLFRPFVLIRFGQLRVDRIGHMALNTEFYLSDLEVSKNGRRTIDFFWCNARPANNQLLKMWRRSLHVSPIIQPLWRCNRLLPGGGLHEVPDRFAADYERTRVILGQTKTHIRLTADEEAAGARKLAEMGIPEGGSFVCFHARDSAYLEKEYPGRDWRYHDFRDASVETFLPAADEMTRRGYFAIRLGAVVKEPLSTGNPMIIDYSNRYRSDFLDIYLLAKCRFLIGTNTGISDTADTFRKPVVKTNMTQFFAEIPLCGAKDIFTPKKFWLKAEKRFIAFRELIGMDLWIVKRTVQYEKCGLEVIENSPEEILDASVEMEERLNGTWQTTEEDEELQSRFWKIFTGLGLLKGPPVSRISSGFLRQNRYLLD